MEKDGRLRTESGDAVEREDACPEIAWATSDLYDEGSPIRPFLGLSRRAASLKWFQSPAAGYDDPIFRELAGRGARVTNAHVNGIPIAEFVMRAVLDHFQQAHLWREAQQARQWKTHDYREVCGTTWLVVGLGSIGGGVALRARAFGATVIGCRRRRGPSDLCDRSVSLGEVNSALHEADVVVLCVPATPETRGLAGDGFIGAMKPGSVLVNVGRGALVDERALLAGLDKGVPEAAVLDVFAEEPLPPDHPFWVHPRVVVTAHNSAGGTGRHRRQAELFGANLDRYLAGLDLLNDITPELTGHASP
jgi:phosphoglycerate dehydrogenase-like enzyme